MVRSPSRRLARLREKHRPTRRTRYSWPLSPSGPPLQGERFEMQDATEENLAAMKAAYPRELTDRKHTILRERAGDPAEDCWLVVERATGDICGYACVAWQDHTIASLQHVVKVEPSQVLCMDDYIFKQQRRKGAHRASIAGRMDRAAERGRTEAVVIIVDTNTASTNSFREFGIRPVGRIYTFPSLGRSISTGLWRRGMRGD